MPRICLTLLAAATLSACAHVDARQAGRTLECRDDRSNWGERFCEIREQTVPAAGPLDVDAGRNGSVSVRGANRGDVLVRARVVAHADSDAAARQLASQVRVNAAGGRIAAEGPDSLDRASWAVSFEVEVPQGTPLTLTTRNGAVALAGFTGEARLQAVNGPLRLADVNGDIRGATTNGPVTVDLNGDRWEGTGLDVETRNGPVRISTPAGYSAELEVETVNGPLRVDDPSRPEAPPGPRRDRDNRPQRLATTLGSGGARIRATTVNGPVTVARR
jgi:hypothetical protein